MRKWDLAFIPLETLLKPVTPAVRRLLRPSEMSHPVSGILKVSHWVWKKTHALNMESDKNLNFSFKT